MNAAGTCSKTFKADQVKVDQFVSEPGGGLSSAVVREQVHDISGREFNRAAPDTTAPTLTITSHTNNQTVNTSSVTLRGTSTDSGRGGNGTTVTVNGQAVSGGTATGNGTATWAATGMLSANMPTTFTITARDNSAARNAP